MEDTITRIREAANYLTQRGVRQPEVGVVLGTGLGAFVNLVNVEVEIPYSDIPHFPTATVEFHKGKLIYGKVGKQSVLVMQGRFHFYEGYTLQQVTFPIRVMKLLGVQTLLLSNAAGGINPSFKKGDLVAIDDHINLQTANPLTGQNLDELGPRFPDMSQPYDFSLLKQLQDVASHQGVVLKRGVYVAVNGPNLETRAEYRFLRNAGTDMVGMSTVPEVIVANHQGMKVSAISVITDECDPDNLQPVDIAEIIKVAGEADARLSKLFFQFVSSL